MIEEGTFEIGDIFMLPCGKEFEGEIFIIVGIRIFNGDAILQAVCKDSEYTISVNSSEIEMLGKEFHSKWKS